jgi:hypothetical protein
MLTLINSLEIEGTTVYQDAGNDLNATPKRVVGFYVVPDDPHVAVGADGKPDLTLTLYRYDMNAMGPNVLGPTGYGVLQLGVAMDVPDDRMARIRAQLKTLCRASADVPVELVKFTGPTASLRPPAGPPLVNSISFQYDRRAGAVPAWRATVALTQEGATVFAHAGASTPLVAAYELWFQHCVAGATVRAWCDGPSMLAALRAAADLDGGLLAATPSASADAGEATRERVAASIELLVSAGALAIDVAPDDGVRLDDDDRGMLDRVARAELARRAGNLLFKPPPPEGDDAAGAAFCAAAERSLCFTLDRSTVLDEDYRPAIHLGAPAVSYVDLSEPRLKIPVMVNADFAHRPVESVTVTLAYHGKQTVTETFEFRRRSTMPTSRSITKHPRRPTTSRAPACTIARSWSTFSGSA